MKKIREYLKLAVFMSGVLAGVQIPGFIDQYGKNLDARVAESDNSIQLFQRDADKYFKGDLNRLVDHYNRINDPVITAGGENIGSLITRNDHLNRAHRDYHQSPYRAYLHVLIYPIAEIRNDVWRNYTYSVVLNHSAIIAGITVGLVLSIALELLAWLAGLLLRTLYRPITRGRPYSR